MNRIVRKKKQEQAKPKWWTYGIAATLTLMLCLTINYSAFSELNAESSENQKLEQQINNITTDNLALQEQIHYLKNDPQTVEREVKKFGLKRPNQKVPVQTTK
jgi:cell division protein FtsL